MDLAALSQTPIQEPIPEDVVRQALLQPPFLTLPGAFNLRDVGGSAPSFVKQGLIFRSGSLAPVPQESANRLHTELHIHRVFDLRSQREVESAPTPVVEGIERIWLAPAKVPDFVDIAHFEGN